MAIFGPIDTGRSVLLQGPTSGQESGSVILVGDRTVAWGRAGKLQTRTVVCNVQAPNAVGGAADHTRAATAYVVMQLRELANNSQYAPIPIQWSSGDGVLTANPFDGWYRLDSVTPLDWSWERHVPCQVVATWIAPFAPRRISLAYSGGALPSNFSGTPLNLLSLPVGSTALEANFSRAGAEGAIPCVLSPVASPEPVVLSTTIANIFKGGVHVYDTINTGTNPVPTSGGTFVHANWVEVFGTDHDFVGDCVITNGLQLLLFQANTAMLATAYLWNTATAVANWQQYAQVNYLDNAGAANGTLRGYSLVRVGVDECALQASLSIATATGNAALVTLRLQRGRYDVRADLKPLTQASTTQSSLSFTLPAVPKILYNSTKLADVVLSETAPVFATDFGYGSAFIANAAQPFIFGILYQNEPGTSQPYGGFNAAAVALGDATSLPINATRSYGFFAIPYGVSGSYSTANLQAEAEGGTLGTGWSSVADGAGSAGFTAKAASGTLSGNDDKFGTGFVPNPGTYDVWFRVRVTTNVGSALEMTLGLWDATSSVFVPSGSTTFNRTAMGTTYAWVRAATGITPTAAHTMQFRAVTALTLGTDWFIDEAVLVPKTLTADNRGPQDVWSQFAYDRSARLIRP